MRGSVLVISGFCMLLCAHAIYLDDDKSDHVHYIAAVEVEWDYAPSGRDRLHKENSKADFYIKRGPGRIGSKYKKAVFREYTDATFTTQKPHPDWLGILGPVLRINIFDKITVHFKNLASRPYSFHIHGGLHKDESRYKGNGKMYEGALYDDGSQEAFKKDDSVPPGGEYVYIWRASYDEGPQVVDDRCVAWLYQSHVDAVRDVESGLVGVLLACRKDSPIKDNSFERKKAVTKDFVLLWKIFDENQSWYIDWNIDKYAGTSLVNKDDKTFQESNRMHSVNGYVFGNLPGLNMCKDDMIGWFLAGYGSQFDVHSVTFHGPTLIYDGERTDMIGIFPMETASSRMLAIHPGDWLIRCAVHEHYEAGMQAYFTVEACNSTEPVDLNSAVEWEYFVAAEEVVWDYAPTGIDQLTGQDLNKPGSIAAEYFSRSNGGLGGQYKKARYVEYTDASFTEKKGRGPAEEHLGLLGPVIKASVNSKIKVTFKNLASRPYSIHPSGVVYDKANEGVLYDDGTTGVDKEDDAVQPGDVHVYTWWVPTFHRSRGYDCTTWIYQSGVDLVRDSNAGLVGPIVICDANLINVTTGRQTGRNQEYFLHMNVVDESKSWYIDDNVRSFGKGNAVSSSSLKRHNINGFMYANMPVFDMKCRREENSIHLMSTGGQKDFFTLYFYGDLLREGYTGRPQLDMQPGLATTLKLVPYNEGEWAVTSGKFSFTDAGMSAKYVVSNCSLAHENNTVRKGHQVPYGRTYPRIYYIAAVEVEWDYAPKDHHIITGKKLSSPDSPGYLYVSKTHNTLGSKYKKAVYREFEDATFSKMKERPPEELYLGILGPVIRAGAGDKVTVVFKNMASRPYSIHPVGIFVNKTDDGYGYEDGTSGETKEDDAVAPGKTHIYEWYLPIYLSPGFADPKCYSLIYHSAVDPSKDIHSGLVGPLYVCKQDLLNENNTRMWPTLDGFQEFAFLFSVFDENLSWYLQENIGKYMTETRAKHLSLDDTTFVASNKMHVINGYIFGTMPEVKHDMTSWADFYFMSVGTQTDIHAAHLNNVGVVSELRGSSRAHDSVPLYPGGSVPVEVHRMSFMSPGKWLIRCAVNEHYQRGMMALWTLENPFQDAIDRMNDLNNFKPPPWEEMETGSKTAIIIGVVCGVIVIIAVGIYCYKKRTKKTPTSETTMSDLQAKEPMAV